MPNMRVKLTTLRLRVIHCTNWASKAHPQASLNNRYFLIVSQEAPFTNTKLQSLNITPFNPELTNRSQLEETLLEDSGLISVGLQSLIFVWEGPLSLFLYILLDFFLKISIHKESRIEFYLPCLISILISRTTPSMCPTKAKIICISKQNNREGGHPFGGSFWETRPMSSCSEAPLNTSITWFNHVKFH